MSEMRTMLVSSMERLLATECAPEVVNAAEKGEWPAKLWQALVDAGMTRAWLPEADGGSGVGLGDVLAVLRAAGRHAAPGARPDTLRLTALMRASVSVTHPALRRHFTQNVGVPAPWRDHAHLRDHYPVIFRNSRADLAEIGYRLHLTCKLGLEIERLQDPTPHHLSTEEGDRQ